MALPLDFRGKTVELKDCLPARSHSLSWSRAFMARAFAFCLASSLLLAAHAESVSFRNDVMAVLAKGGCNSGPCHGNANGKGGFKISLRGDDPDGDFDILTRDQFARRIDPQNPDQSLLLLKASAVLAHEGGQRFKTDSREYKILRDWVAAGARRDAPDTPKAVKLEVTPLERILIEPETSVQLQATVTYSDGRREDVTSLVVYDPSAPFAKVSHDGLVEADHSGEASILVRYLRLQVAVRLAFVPARPNFKWAKPPANNYIDEQVFAKLKTVRTNPSEPASDEVFVRRAYLDLLGLLPTASEARAFLADKRKDKRAKLVDQLLERPEFADFWALKWADLLRLEERGMDQKGVGAFHAWIRASIAENKPMDQFVRELIAARGSTYANPPANFYRVLRDPVSRAETAAQLFLGVRLQCAQCHNHPFDRWTQDDYYNWADVFSRVQYKIIENNRQDKNDSHEFKGEQVVFIARKGEVKNARTGQSAEPHFLGAPGGALPEETDYLQALAEWVTAPDNPMFARAQANRIWYHLMGRGIVDPIDDFRATNPASHPALLELLAKDFAKSGYNLRYLIRVIMNSRTYQLSSEPNDTNTGDEINYSHVLARRLGAEQMVDVQSQVAGVALKFDGYPDGVRAAQLPAMPEGRRRRSSSNPMPRFLEIFGRPQRQIPSECERSCEPTLNQTFQMISGPMMNDLVADANNRLGTLQKSGKSDTEVVEELYLTALTRLPRPVELTKTQAYLAKAKDRRAALEDILWGLMNAKEFVLRQ